jgi:peroxiredoxin Q/BCP
VAYFAASVDDAATNRKFAESLDADYPILSDPGRTVAAAYGVLSAAGLPSRWTFYIGADGRILDIDTRVSARTAGEDVARRLGELGVRRKSG